MIKENYEELVDAIINQAIKDYSKAIRALKKDKNNEAAQIMLSDVLSFFHSEWFKALADINPNRLIDKINRKVAKIDDKTILKTGKIS